MEEEFSKMSVDPLTIQIATKAIEIGAEVVAGAIFVESIKLCKKK